MVVPNWTGYIGQWDNRIWDPNMQGVEPKTLPIGLMPGFTKRHAAGLVCHAS